MDIKKHFEKLNITEYGIISAKDADDLILHSTSAFAPKSKYNTIYEIFEGAKSVIVYLAPYNHGQKSENVSLYATGMDYHIVCSHIGQYIIDQLTKYGYGGICFADSGPLDERKLALKAGLGIKGKNGFVINEQYGTFTFIGYIITDCEFPYKNFETGNCLNCGKCINSCPGGALTEKGFLEEKCLSYLTQKKGILNDDEIKLIKKGSCAWGCDICQNCCPMNKNTKLTPIPYFKENLILCINDEYLSNKEFKDKYKNRAFTWRGKTVIERNLSILNDKK